MLSKTVFNVGVILCAGLVWSANAETTFPQPYGDRDDVRQYAEELSQEHGFEQSDVLALLAGANQRQDIIDRISKPAETVWTWARYKSRLVDDERVRLGIEFWTENTETLKRAAATYGVSEEYIVAILGIETRYGQYRGAFPVLDALMTLGFDYPPRSDFFRRELTQFMLLAREEGKDPRTLMGSYAGAMGYGQFISSSYRHYAVDFDDDGVRDIWENPVDAIGSIANYFARHHWKGTGPVAVRVNVPGEAVAQADAMANQGLNLKFTLGELRAAGLEIEDLADDRRAALFRVEGEEGNEYWVALHDFYVITRYNRSHLYALAIFHLADAIRNGRADT